MASPHQDKKTILLIGAFKLFKGVMLLITAIGALRLLHKDVAETVNHWVEILRVDPDNHLIHGILEKALAVTPRQLAAISAGTFFYSSLLLTEGVGLLLQKQWAEYFTVITTAALVPLEIYELAKHVTVAKIVVLIVNVAIVWYLVVRLRSERRAAAAVVA